MPVLIAAMWTAFLALIPTIVGRVLLALGLGYVSYRGLDGAFTVAKETLFSNLSGFSAVTLQLAGVLEIGSAINIIASSYLAKLAVDGLINGVIKKLAVKSD